MKINNEISQVDGACSTQPPRPPRREDVGARVLAICMRVSFLLIIRTGKCFSMLSTFCIVSRADSLLGPNRASIRRTPGESVVARPTTVELYLHSSIRLYDVALNYNNLAQGHLYQYHYY
jgi:hypothetical protein